MDEEPHVKQAIFSRRPKGEAWANKTPSVCIFMASFSKQKWANRPSPLEPTYA
jgi:hypothetical protein